MSGHEFITSSPRKPTKRKGERTTSAEKKNPLLTPNILSSFLRSPSSQTTEPFFFCSRTPRDTLNPHSQRCKAPQTRDELVSPSLVFLPFRPRAPLPLHFSPPTVAEPLASPPSPSGTPPPLKQGRGFEAGDMPPPSGIALLSSAAAPPSGRAAGAGAGPLTDIDGDLNVDRARSGGDAGPSDLDKVRTTISTQFFSRKARGGSGSGSWAESIKHRSCFALLRFSK